MIASPRKEAGDGSAAMLETLLNAPVSLQLLPAIFVAVKTQLARAVDPRKMTLLASKKDSETLVRALQMLSAALRLIRADQPEGVRGRPERVLTAWEHSAAVFNVLALLLEAIRATFAQPKGDSGGNFIEEEMCRACLVGCREGLETAAFLRAHHSSVPAAGTGPPPWTAQLLAQVVTCALALLRHPREVRAQLQLEAAGCLDAALAAAPSPALWRAFLPGTFSGLYQTCVSGPPRVAARCLATLLRLVGVVTEDVVPENQALLASLPEGARGSASGSALQAYTAMLAKLALQTSVDEPVSTSERDSASPASARREKAHQQEQGQGRGEMPVVPVTAQWRADLLQKLTRHLLSAVSSAAPHCTTALAMGVTAGLRRLLLASRAMLGPALTLELLLLLAAYLAHSARSVRVCAAEAVDALRSTMGSAWLGLQALLVERLVRQCGAVVEEAARGASIDEHAYVHGLEQVLGLCRLLGDDTRLALPAYRAGTGRNLAGDLLELLRADTDAVRAALLVTRRYAYLHRSCEAGYYRLPWRSARGGRAKRLVRTLLLRLGGGAGGGQVLSELTTTVALSTRRLRRRLSGGQSLYQQQQHQQHEVELHAGDAVREGAERLLSGWAAMSLLVLGGLLPPAATAARETCATPLQLPPVCTVCGQSKGDGAALSVCTGCRRAWYCGKTHQRQHWPAHRADCGRPCTEEAESQETEEVAVVAGEEDGDLDEECVLGAWEGGEVAAEVWEAVGAALDCLALQRETAAAHPHDHHTTSVIAGQSTARSVLSFAAAAALECLANCAMVQRPAGFRPQLQRALYPLLEACSDQQDIVLRTAALSSLRRIALYCGYEDAGALLRDNMDYVCDQVCALCRHNLLLLAGPGLVPPRATYHQNAPVVLDLVFSAAFREGGMAGAGGARALALVKDAVLETLDGLDRLAATGQLPDVQVLALLRLTHALVRNLADPPSNIAAEVEGGAVSGPEHASSALAAAKQSLAAFLESAAQLRSPPFDQDDAATTTEQPGVEAEGSEDGAEPGGEMDPPGLPLIEDVLARCCYYLASARLGLRGQSLVASSMSDGLLRLAGCRRRLLPLVHRCWPPLMQRLLEVHTLLSSSTSSCSHVSAEPPVEALLLVSLLGLLSVLCRVCGDFVAHKFRDDLFPRVVLPLLLLLTQQQQQRGQAEHTRPSQLLDIDHSDHDPQDPSSASLRALTLAAACQEGPSSLLSSSTAVSVRGVERSGRFRTDAKLKLALLEFLLATCSQRALGSLMRDQAFVLAWLLLPLLRSQQSGEVAILATQCLSSLLLLNPLRISALLSAVLSAARGDGGGLGSWSCLCADERLIQIYTAQQQHQQQGRRGAASSSSRLLSVPGCEALVLQLSGDAHATDAVHGILQRHHSDRDGGGGGSPRWMESNLGVWSRCA